MPVRVMRGLSVQINEGTWYKTEAEFSDIKCDLPIEPQLDEMVEYATVAGERLDEMLTEEVEDAIEVYTNGPDSTVRKDLKQAKIDIYKLAERTMPNVVAKVKEVALQIRHLEKLMGVKLDVAVTIPEEVVTAQDIVDQVTETGKERLAVEAETKEFLEAMSEPGSENSDLPDTPVGNAIKKRRSRKAKEKVAE